MKGNILKHLFYLFEKVKKFLKKQKLEKNSHKIISYNNKYIDRILNDKREKKPIDFTIENKKSTKDLSIIIPFYNCEKYVAKCLQSIFDQNLKMDYEIICINDGSTDNSLNIVNNLAEKNHNIRVISQKNKGSSAARNVGLNTARGKYILFVDSDDYIIENSINYYYERIVNEKADIIIGRICKYITKYNISFPMKYSTNNDNLIDICNNTTGTAWGKIYKRDLWNDIRFFEGYMYEDSIIFLNIFMKAKRIISDPTPMYVFRSSNSSLFKKSKENISTIDMIWLLEIMAEKRYFDKLDNYQFQIVLWNLSIMTYERINCLNDEKLLECCFIKSKEILNYILEKNKNISIEFYGKNKMNYKRIIEAYNETDFYKWKYYCGVINYSSTI